MTINQIVFLVMAALALVGAIGVVTIKSPVRAAIALVVNFFVLGLMYFMMGTQLLGISQIMVYAGAIMVLFLFVIMILRSDKETDKPESRGWKWLAAIGGGATICLILIAKVALPFSGTIIKHKDADYGTPQAIGYSLFTNYVWPFEVVSILLLVGIVGSIMLAKRRF